MPKAKRDNAEFRKSGDYLPDFLKDFHDQKDLFKTLFDYYRDHLAKDLPNVNWRDSQIFCIDFFLWFLAAHGYTLQKSRANVQWADIKASIEAYNKKSLDSLGSILNKWKNNKTI